MMMDYQYRRRAFQNLHVEQEEAKNEMKQHIKKSKTMMAYLSSFFCFFHHTS
ncbi:hypothetical protein ACFVAD_02780 [Sutcliffiella sp. NPDC057660]|uniref:hypothetical protein n=1 Tax=Sutcliffiella sp. NPDC057660 TaxID=3346199 RepID=UPI0036761334